MDTTATISSPDQEHLESPSRENCDELQRAFDFFNRHLFEGQLPHCMITLQREKRTIGYFSSSRFVRHTGQTVDEIAMNPSYFASDTLQGTLSTLVHEMAHAWQHHFGKAGRARYHNQEWADKMDGFGLAASHNGRPGGKRTGDHMSHYIVRGGLFAHACEKLLTEQFVLSWMDRFVTARHGTHVSDQLHPPSTSAKDAKGEQNDPRSKIDAVVSTLLRVPEQLRDKLVVTGGETKAANRSNRAKYGCSTCQTKVWGKPGIRVLCGRDGCQAAVMVVL